jgi:hypothetical protein
MNWKTWYVQLFTLLCYKLVGTRQMLAPDHLKIVHVLPQKPGRIATQAILEKRFLTSRVSEKCSCACLADLGE